MKKSIWTWPPEWLWVKWKKALGYRVFTGPRNSRACYRGVTPPGPDLLKIFEENGWTER